MSPLRGREGDPMEPRQSASPTITRVALIEVVDRAAQGLTPSTREKLVGVARTTGAVAVGWFHCHGVKCPASQARRRNQAFQEAFDRAMAERFGRYWNADSNRLPVAPFVVTVVDSEEGAADAA